MNYIAIPKESSSSKPTINSTSTTEIVAATIHNLTPGPLNAFCITLYNEDEISFSETLSALFESLLYFYKHDTRPDVSTICIVADGYDRLDPNVIELLRQANFIGHEFEKEYCDGVQAYSSVHKLQFLYEFFSGNVTQLENNDPQQVHVMVLLKEHNQGKLHSHFLFFNYYCHEVDPVYCFQIDVGTNLANDSVLHLIRYMEQQPKLAAIAPRVMPDVPKMNDGFLIEWQYMDFAYRKAISWPFEVLAGFLSVIPGQAGIFRWEALQTSDLDNTHRVSFKEPLSEYFRGMQACNPVERIMYLAEDRIIGAAIVLSQDKTWQLGYQPEATATTDSCQSFKELCRQRRRWTNSSLACRYWLFSQLKSFLFRDDRSAQMKVEFTTSSIAQFLLALREFFVPAQLVALIIVFLGVITISNSSIDNLLQNIFWCVLVVDIMLTIMSTTGFAIIKSPFFGYSRTAVGWVTGALFFTILCIKLSVISMLILFSPAIAIFAMAFVLPGSMVPLAIRGHLFPFPNLLMFCTLLCYAIWNLSDVSWGTKGLTSASQTEKSRRQTRRLRNMVFAAFLFLNCAAVGYVIAQHELNSTSLNIVIISSSILEASIALAALTYIVMKRCRKNLKHLHSSSSVAMKIKDA
jgi:chitin synthase